MVVTILLWTLEIWCARVIAKENDQLRLPKTPSDDEASYEGLEAKQSIKLGAPTWSQKLCYILYEGPRTRFKHYFSMSVWPASMVISVQQMSVLAYSSTLITFLLEAGYSLSTVTIARGTGSTMAVMATFITPMAANYLRKRYVRNHNTSAADMEGKVVRTVGLWGVSSQFFFMVRLSPPHFGLAGFRAAQCHANAW
jgi:iron-regulated transporter 1